MPPEVESFECRSGGRTTNQAGLRRVRMRKCIPQLDEAGELLQSDRQKEKARADYGDAHAPYRSFLNIGLLSGDFLSHAHKASEWTGGMGGGVRGKYTGAE